MKMQIVSKVVGDEWRKLPLSIETMAHRQILWALRPPGGSSKFNLEHSKILYRQNFLRRRAVSIATDSPRRLQNAQSKSRTSVEPKNAWRGLIRDDDRTRVH